MQKTSSGPLCARSFGLTGILVAVTLSAVLGGCQGFSTDGLEAIIDDHESYVLFPGTRIARGTFHALGWNTTFKYDDGVVLALDEEQRLTIFPLNGAPCKAGVAAQYDPSWAIADGDQGPGFVAYTEALDDRGFGRLHFVDQACHELMDPPLEDAQIFRLPNSGFSSILVTTRDNSVLALSQSTPQWSSRVLATEASDLRVFGGFLWSIEKGKLINRDSNLTVVDSIGTNVRDLTPLDGVGALAYMDDDGLHLTTGVVGKGRLIATDACSPAASLYSGDYLTYYSPCAEKRLVARKPSLTETSTESPIDIAVGASSTVIIADTPGATQTGPHVAYLVDADGGVGTLWSGPLKGERQQIGEHVVLDSVAFGTSRYVRAIADWNGQVGRLIQWEPGSPPIEVAQGVASPHPSYESLVLINYDGKLGDRARISADGKVQIVVHGSPSGATSSVEIQAFLTDFDGSTGTVNFYSKDLGVRPLVADVGAREFSLALWKSPAVTYRKRLDPTTQTGILGVRFPESCDAYEVEAVSEWRIIHQPEPGILYATANTANPGIWFARAQ